jgi:hypothetical protein
MQDKRRVFIEPVLRGDRFSDPSLPREILPDLDSYLNIVIAVAKEIYRSGHPKKRLPKGFEERFKVRLIGIAAGSVVPQFHREYDQESWTGDEFDQARDLVNRQLLSLEGSPKCIEGFPEKIIPLFKHFGENLRGDETIELKIPGQKKSPTYSRKVRSTILSINQKPFQAICYLTGAICGFDAKSGFFNLVLGDSEIRGPLEGSFDISLREIAAKYKIEEISITLVGIAKYHPDHSISQIERLQHVTVFREGTIIFLPDPFKRLLEIGRLHDGWLDGKGKEFNKEDLQDVKKWIAELLQPADIPAPFIYPSPDNLVIAEWSLGFWEVNFSFEFAQKSISLHATHTSSEEIREDRLPFNTESIGRAAKFLKNFLVSNEE